MAEVLLGVVTEVVLTKLISLGNEGIGRFLGVNEDLQRLTEQFEMIQALLSDAERKSPTNKAIEVWLKRLENASMEVDDLLDEIAYYEVLKKKILKGNKDKVCISFSSSNSFLFRLKMFSKIKKMILKIEEIYKFANQIGLRPIEKMNSPSDPRKVQLTDPFVDDSKIIGRDDDLRKVINQLLGFYSKDGKNNLSVMGIVGMAGQGKTTLAQLLIKDDEVKNHFEKIIWTCVSDDFDVDRVLKDMLQSLTGEASQLTNREAIVKGLSKELGGKRFLLVLDDVWNENSQLWDCMNNALQSLGGPKGSKIVVTTRSELVVTIMNGFHYPLGVLSEKHSQELFEKIAFGNGIVRKTPELVKTGERIVVRCGGVPLALRAIGGLMSTQRDTLEWHKIAESNIWNLLDGVSSAIKLSFDHLPSLSIKQCFTYCSIFPKDSIIDKKDLIHQWMAHGLLNPSREGDLEMEVVGNNYFKILLQRSFLEVHKSDDLFGNIISCKMHDLVHDFASETSKGRILIAKVGELNNDNIKSVVHLSITLDEGYTKTSLNISKNDFSMLKTLHLSDFYNFTHHFLNQYKCKKLRVLSIRNWEIDELPISVAKMKHLRYLDIRNTRICRTLPKFVSKIYNMQTLQVQSMVTMPKGLVRLINLRHLNIYTKPPLCVPKEYLVPWMGKLENLRTLNCFPVSRENGCHIEELGNLNHLEGTLQVLGLENVANQGDAKKANLSRKCYIESLELDWGNANNIDNSIDQTVVLEGLQPHPCLKALRIRGFMGNSLPSWISTMQNLMRLELQYLSKCEKIPPLGHLPFLKILQIFDMESLTCICNDFYGWPNLVTSSTNSSHQSTFCSSTVVVFPSLVDLNVCGLFRLKEWSDMVIPSYLSSSDIVPFPSLKHVKISSCSSVTYLPHGLFSGSTGLESLTIDRCPELVSCPNVINLHSLKELSIYPCPKLKVLPLGVDACTSLCELSIHGPASIVQGLALRYLTNLRRLKLSLSTNIINPYNNDCTSSSSKLETYLYYSSNLEKLTLYGEPQFKSIPEQIQHFKSLRSLIILDFDGLETIPEWFGEFHSLESLVLGMCKSLANLPSKDVMCSRLTNLNKLFIYGCPILRQRCKKETGAEWHKIAHIPVRFI